MGQWVWSGQMTNNLINLDLIEMIRFCLKIYNLWRHPHPWVGIWMVGWVSWSMGGVRFMICTDTPTHGGLVGWFSGSMGVVRSND